MQVYTSFNGKDRSPAAVVGLSIITVGIYYLVWYYKINKEIKLHNPQIKVSPGWAVIALLVPVANLVTAYGTAARIRQMQLDEGASQTISPVVALLLAIFLGIGYPLYIASQLREHWHFHAIQSLKNASTQSVDGVPNAQQLPQGSDRVVTSLEATVESKPELG